MVPSRRVQARRCLLSALVAVCVFGAAALANAQTAVGTATAVSGEVQLKRASATSPLTQGAAVEQGDAVTTGPGGSATITLADQSQLEVGALSTLELTAEVVGPAGRVRSVSTLLSGIVRSIVKTTAGAPLNFEIHTPNAVVAARGTQYDTAYTEGQARPGYASCKQFTDVGVYEGTVEISSIPNPGAAHMDVSAGYETTVACNLAPQTPGPLGVTGARGLGGFKTGGGIISTIPGATTGATAPPPAPPPPPPLPPPLPPPGNRG